MKTYLFFLALLFSQCARNTAPQTVFSFKIFEEEKVTATAGKLLKYKGPRNDSLFLYFKNEGWRNVLVAKDIRIYLHTSYSDILIDHKKYYHLSYNSGDTTAISKPGFTHDCTKEIAK